MSEPSKKANARSLIFLHVILLIYVGSSVMSKLASGQEFLSPKFIMLYGGVVVLLMVYAVLWQQVLKRLPLTVAFANKSAVMIWGMVIGAIMWHERISWLMIVGTVIIIAGVCLVVMDD